MVRQPASREAIEAARARLYRPDVTDADRDRYAALVAVPAQQPTEPAAGLPAAAEQPPARPRSRRRTTSGVVGVLLVLGAAVLAVGLQHGATASSPAASATRSESPTALHLRDVPVGWRLSSLVRRDDAMASGSSLTINRSVTGGEFLLVVRCPVEDGRFRVVLTETGERFGGPWTGTCGPQTTVPLALERGVGRVEVVITTRGELPFAGAVVRRGSGSPRAAVPRQDGR
ncbi:hypothetical protein [uncultured Amnibacterium sp.]|uniref:hypothetical protein n=1 Tax=uncultured Amnibacterium sp. TaxID=1631851 RepID=UPI0035CC4DA8